MKYIKKIKPFYIDKRGEMSYLLDGKVKINSALFITSKKGSIRANHYHKKDSHYVFLIKGKMEYIAKDIKRKNSKKEKVVLKTGDLVYSPPMVAHAMKFLEESAFLALTIEPRDQETYEKDTVSIKLI